MSYYDDESPTSGKGKEVDKFLVTHNSRMMMEISQKLDINEKMEGKRVDPSQLGKGGMIRKNS